LRREFNTREGYKIIPPPIQAKLRTLKPDKGDKGRGYIVPLREGGMCRLHAATRGVSI